MGSSAQGKITLTQLLAERGDEAWIYGRHAACLTRLSAPLAYRCELAAEPVRQLV
jgi:hypothetical protein